MNNHIVTAEINILDGLLYKSIPFSNGLNILSGENGTCKTQVLTQIKSHKIKASDPGSLPKIIAYSPKRNSERKKIENIFTEMRQQNRMLIKYIDEKAATVFQDSTFVTYASFAELFFLDFESQCKDGGNRIEKMDELTREYTHIIKKLFVDYELVSEWDDSSGFPQISVRKKGTDIKVDSLSLGEQEILSLVFNLYASRERNDIFLIDEPEIHLNWHLEEALFNFFDWFCESNNKQMVVATHSRIVFQSKFLKKTQFLFWKEGHIEVGRQIPDEQRNKIAGEGIEIIKMGEFYKPTFFVEDQAHQDIIEIIAVVLGVEVSVSQCGNSQNVVSLFRHSISEGGWTNCFFIIDGDNQGNPFPGNAQFIHLDKYSIENYLFDFETAAKVTGKTVDQIIELIYQAIIERKDAILKKNKFFEFLLDRFKCTDINDDSLSKLDGSEIIDVYIGKTGMSFEDYTNSYVGYLDRQSSLSNIFPEKIISAIKP